MNLIQKIKNGITEQTNGITASDNIFIIDYKSLNGGGVEVLDAKPVHHGVHLSNDQKIEVFYIAFKENALREKVPQGQVKQCECVLFPTSLNENDWMLFVETKYAGSLRTALDANIDYPNTMIKQIISTVTYFRNNNFLSDKKVFAIVSFPKLIENLSEAFFTRSEMTAEEILLKYRIIVRATNEGKIISRKRLRI